MITFGQKIKFGLTRKLFFCINFFKANSLETLMWPNIVKSASILNTKLYILYFFIEIISLFSMVNWTLCNYLSDTLISGPIWTIFIFYFRFSFHLLLEIYLKSLWSKFWNIKTSKINFNKKLKNETFVFIYTRTLKEGSSRLENNVKDWYLSNNVPTFVNN